MIITSNLHSETKSPGWLRYCFQYNALQFLKQKYCLCLNYCIHGRPYYSQLCKSDQIFTQFETYDDQKSSFEKYVGNCKDILIIRTI